MATRIPGDFIRGVRLFENLTHDEVQQLLDAAEEVEFAEGQPVFHEGKKKRALYVVIEGKVRITLAAPSIAETELTTVEPQGVFGESSFFHQSLHHATAYCLTDVRLIRLRRSKYRELLKEGNLAAYKLAANAADILGERLQQTDEWIEKLLHARQDKELIVHWQKFRRGISGGFSAPITGFTP